MKRSGPCEIEATLTELHTGTITPSQSWREAWKSVAGIYFTINNQTKA
jgi:hypothetical protein